MTSLPSIDVATRDAVLESLFKHDPPAHVVAISENGLFVPMPPSVSAKQAALFAGRTSALQLVIPADLPIVIETWEAAHRTGASGCAVHLLAVPSRTVNIHFVDARYRFGVFLGFIVGYGDLAGGVAVEQTPVRPRVWTARMDEFGVFIDADEAVGQILGWSRAELVGHRSLEFIHPEDQPRAIAYWMDVRSAAGAERRAQLRHKHRDGSWVWFEFTDRDLLSDPAQRCVISEMIDISDQMAAHEALRASELLLRRLTEALPLGVLQCDAAGRIVYRNERLGAIVGNDRAVTIQEQFANVASKDRAVFASTLHDVLALGGDADLEVTLLCDGAVLCCDLKLRALVSQSGAGAGAIVCVSDITEPVRMRGELEFRATYDALTGCRNRASILSILESFVKTAPKAGSGLAVVFVDLDGFKLVNDRLGHAVGDELLRRTGARLTATARAVDVVGRLGGDEFLVVCRDVGSRQQAVAIAGRIASVLHEPIDLGVETVVPQASVGVAWTASVSDADVLVAAADAAMYDSKRGALGRAVLSTVLTVPRPLR